MDPQNTAQNNGQSANAGQQAEPKVQIPAHLQEKYPDLVAKIQASPSMTGDERSYWYQIMPIMTEEQIKRLHKILDDEKEQLEKLDEDYQKELTEMNKKHMAEWDDLEREKKRQARMEAEQSHEENEAAAEAALLEQLDEL